MRSFLLILSLFSLVFSQKYLTTVLTDTRDCNLLNTTAASILLADGSCFGFVTGSGSVSVNCSSTEGHITYFTDANCTSNAITLTEPLNQCSPHKIAFCDTQLPKGLPTGMVIHYYGPKGCSTPTLQGEFIPTETCGVVPCSQEDGVWTSTTCTQ